MKQWSQFERLKVNTLTSVALQITQLGRGFIVPWLILHYYGANVNGLMHSIVQLIVLVSFLEAGVGPVLQAALYRPLHRHDRYGICIILKCAQEFYNKIGYVLVIYSVALVWLFPYITHNQFDVFYTGTLIVAVFISSLSRYFFGIVNVLFLQAAQQGYIVNCLTIVTMTISVIVEYLLIRSGQSIQTVKLACSLVFMIRPLCFWLYVRQHYLISSDVPLVAGALRQQWNGAMQHISSIAIDFSPTITLSLFTDFRSVSIFSVYNIVLSGLKRLFLSLFSEFWHVLGEFYAKEEVIKLNKFVKLISWITHSVVTLVFTITAIIIVPFVKVYTTGVDGVNYCTPLFASLFTLNIAMQCYKFLYDKLIQIAGHFKQTQYCYLLSTIVAVVSTVFGVQCIGIDGAVIGGTVALIYQLLWTFSYDKKKLAKSLSWLMLAKQISVDVLTYFLILLLSRFISVDVVNYRTWLAFSLEIGIIAVVVSILVNFIFYRSNVSCTCRLFYELK